MGGSAPDFEEYVLKIHEVLDRIDYYRLLGVGVQSAPEEIKKAYFGIMARFHPDRNRGADPKIRKALYDISKRLNEAYKVLCDPERRMLYNAGLDSGKKRLELDGRRTMVPKSPEDSIRSPRARDFYRQAQDSLKSNNLQKAELHIQMASINEKENPVIEALKEEIRAAKEKGKKQA